MMKTFKNGIIIGIIIGFLVALLFFGRYETTSYGPQNMILRKYDRLTGKSWIKLGFNNWEEE